MAEGPCLNPNCKSHGKPHPNCRCYGSFAQGGSVEHFCLSKQGHKPKCQYYTEELPQKGDSHHSVSAYLAHEGLHGLLDQSDNGADDSIYKYNRTIKRGEQKFKDRMMHLFDKGSPDKVDLTKAKETIEEWLDKGGMTHTINQEIDAHRAQNFASGGDVSTKASSHDPHIASAYPEQNVMLQAAKGRMSNYLSSLKPQKNMPKLAFDHEPDQTEQKKKYHSALEIAAHPLAVFDKIHSGKINADDVMHFKNLYPEMDGVLQKKLTEEITNAQLKGHKPSYKVRQGMSLFLGVPLSGEMTPQNIQAAQAVFQAQKGAANQQQPEGGKPKKNTSSLTKSDDAFLTGNQARTARQQKQ